MHVNWMTNIDIWIYCDVVVIWVFVVFSITYDYTHSDGQTFETCWIGHWHCRFSQFFFQRKKKCIPSVSTGIQKTTITTTTSYAGYMHIAQYARTNIKRLAIAHFLQCGKFRSIFDVLAYQWQSKIRWRVSIKWMFFFVIVLNDRQSQLYSNYPKMLYFEM